MKKNKEIIFRNCALFLECTSEINNTQIDHVKDLDIVMPMYNLIEYINNYLKESGSLWQYYRDEPTSDNNGNITNFLGNSVLLKTKVKITGNTPADGNTKVAKISVPLTYISNYWKTLEMPLINCKINLILTWSEDCVISSATGKTKLKITDTKLYFPVLTSNSK